MLSSEKLLLIRNLHNISQGELADRVGVSRNYISMMENRKQEIPTELYDKWIKALYGQYDFRETEEGKKKLKEKEEKLILKDLEKEKNQKPNKNKVNKK